MEEKTGSEEWTKMMNSIFKPFKELFPDEIRILIHLLECEQGKLLATYKSINEELFDGHAYDTGQIKKIGKLVDKLLFLNLIGRTMKCPKCKKEYKRSLRLYCKDLECQEQMIPKLKKGANWARFGLQLEDKKDLKEYLENLREEIDKIIKLISPQIFYNDGISEIPSANI